MAAWTDAPQGLGAVRSILHDLLMKSVESRQQHLIQPTSAPAPRLSILLAWDMRDDLRDEEAAVRSAILEVARRWHRSLDVVTLDDAPVHGDRARLLTWVQSLLLSDVAAVIAFPGGDDFARAAERSSVPHIRVAADRHPTALLGLQGARATGGFEAPAELRKLITDWLLAFELEITAERVQGPLIREQRQRSLMQWEQLSFEQQGELALGLQLPRRAVSVALLEDAEFVGLPAPALVGISRAPRTPTRPAVHSEPPARCVDGEVADLLGVLKARQVRAYEQARDYYGWGPAEAVAVLRRGVQIIRADREHIAAGGERNHRSFVVAAHWLEIYRELA